MTREEKIAKLKTVKLIIPNLSFSYDMGLAYNILTSEGAAYTNGLEWWPISKRRVSAALRRVHAKVLSGEQIKAKEVRNLKVFRRLFAPYTSWYGYTTSIDEEEKEKYLSLVREQMSKLKLENNLIYSYMEDEGRDLHLFDNYNDLEDFVIETLGYGITKYEDMDEKQLSYFYGCAEDEGWCNTMPFTS